MKILSINEAIEKKLLKNIGGLSIQENAKIMKVSDQEKLEETIKNMLKDVSEPSIIVSDDEQEIFCITTEREKSIFNTIERSKQRYIYPKVYTQDNTPVLVMGENTNNRYSTIPIVQDNKNGDIREFTLKVKSAKGGIEETEITHRLEKPIELFYEDGLLRVNGQNIEITDNDNILIGIEDFLDYTYKIKLEDGRESDLTFGYNNIPNEYVFCRDIVNKIDNIKTEGIGNITEDSIKCIGYEKVDGKYYESKPEKVEIKEPEYDKQLELLMEEDKELDEKIANAEKALEQRNNGAIEL